MGPTTINVRYVNPPKGTSKFGSIKTSDDMFYGVAAGMLPTFRPGGTYSITFTEREYNGKIYKTVETAKAAPAAGETGHVGGGQDPGLSERIFVCGAINSILQNPSHNPIAMTGQTAARLVAVWRDAWRSAMVPSIAKTTAETEKELDDEIPF